MRPIIETVRDLPEHSSWRKYLSGIRELELLEAPRSAIQQFRYACARDCYLAFVDIMMGGELVVEPFHEIIGSALEDLAFMRYPRLIISCAPRSGKSMLMQHFVAWLYGRNERISNIVSSYSRALSGIFEKGILRILRDYKFGLIFPEFSGFRSKFSNVFESGGILEATSPGSGLTGMTAGSYEMEATSPGGLIIDDILKSARKISEAKALPPWWGEEASTRRTNKWIQLIIGTRWLVKDLHGIVLDKDGIYDPHANPLGWRYLNFEAICEKPDEDRLCRARGETHWPSNPLFSLPMLEAQRRTMGKNRFSALYQGHPVAEEGALFQKKWFLVEEEKPICDIVYFSLDCALSEKETADESAITVLGLEKPPAGQKRSDQIWVLEQAAGQWAFPDLLTNLKALVKHYRPTHLVIERAASGISLIQTLKKETKLHIDPPDGYKAIKSKMLRLQQTLPLFENDRVRFVKNEIWNEKIREQLINYPISVNDDRMDSLVWGLIYYQEFLDVYTRDLLEDFKKSGTWSLSGKRRERLGLTDSTWADSRYMGSPSRRSLKRNIGWDDSLG